MFLSFARVEGAASGGVGMGFGGGGDGGVSLSLSLPMSGMGLGGTTMPPLPPFPLGRGDFFRARMGWVVGFVLDGGDGGERVESFMAAKDTIPVWRRGIR